MPSGALVPHNGARAAIRYNRPNPPERPMSHIHHHHKSVLKRALLLIAAFMLVEIAGGLLTNSLALLSDAGHMLSDAIALALSLAAFHWSDRPTTLKNTFGYRRGEIIAAALNGLTLAAIVLWIVIEAIGRLLHPPEVASLGMLAVAVTGLAVNILIAVWMHRGSDIHHNLNMKSAYLHVLGDLLGSVGAILAALLMLAFGWRWADPLVSLLIAALIGKSSVGVLKSALHILMEGAPTHIDHERLLTTLRAADGVIAVHDLHLWTITSGLNALSCHIVVAGDLRVHDAERIVQKLAHELAQHGIQHSTIQTESEAHGHSDSLVCACEAEDAHEHHHH